MGTYDISRVAFDPDKLYDSVRMQQGRVLTDDDWNENERIENEDRRRSRADIIGPYGSPDDGYLIENLTISGNSFDFDIDAGVLYLGGLRLQHAQETYRLQHNWLEQPPSAYAVPGLSASSLTQSDLVYLEAWQQPVCAIEDNELFETALNGPDTTVRVRNMVRVKIQAGVGNDGCADAWTQLQNIWKGKLLGQINDNYERVPNATLLVSFPGNGLPDDLCSPKVIGGYLGAENQAIRVQLRKNDTFTWGFDDASPLYRVTQVSATVAGVTTTTITMLTPPKDQHHWPLSGQVVEILSWSALLPNGEKISSREGFITKVDISYDPTAKTFTLLQSLPVNFGTDWQGKVYDPTVLPVANPVVYFYMKIWDRGTDITSPAEIPFIPPTAVAPIPAPVTLGNTGIAIQLFGSDFVPGDYWVIAARPEAPDLVVPWALQLKNGIPPVGIHRFFAPLAIINWTFDTATGQVTGKIDSDCRKHFKPLTEQECCCTYTVGDGKVSKGDFRSIQKAINALPSNGGKLCILPGIHHDTVFISKLRNIEICGCGPNAVIMPDVPDDQADHSQIAVFSIVSSGNIKLCNLTILNPEGTDIAIFRTNENNPPQVCGIRIENCMLLAARYAVTSDMSPNSVANGNIRISNNQIGQFDVDGGVPAIFTLGDHVLIERNRIVVIPAPDKRNPNNPGQPNDPTGCIYDRCCNKKPHYTTPGLIWGTVSVAARYICGVTGETAGKGPYIAQGGIQIGSTSERVKIVQNTIIGGAGIGVAFGHVFVGDEHATNVEGYNIHATMDNNFNDTAAARFNSFIYDILIVENTILLMGLSGIGVSAFFSLTNIKLMFRVIGLGIYRNTISSCARQTSTLQDLANKSSMGDQVAFGGIILAAAERPIIRDNHIMSNGIINDGGQYPVCGIFILYGEQVEVTHNRILDNGIFHTIDGLRTGNRGGIVIRKAIQLLDTRNGHDTDAPPFEGLPAANIAGNDVDQPIGLALYLIPSGHVSVLGNRFTARTPDTTDPEYQLASTILIMQLGISRDLLGTVTKMRTSYYQLDKVIPAKDDQSNIDRGLVLAYQYLPGGRILFANNQISYLPGKFNKGKKRVFSAQLIASLDDVGYLSNQSEITAYFSQGMTDADLTFADTLLLGVTIRSNDNRWQEGRNLTLASLRSFATANICVNNQATHPLLVKPASGPNSIITNNIIF